MRIAINVFVLIAATLQAGCSSKTGGGGSAAAKDDKELIQGNWQVLEGEKNGQKRTFANEMMIMEFMADAAIFKKDKTENKANYMLRSGTTPKEIDLTPTQGGDKGKVLPGIYELSGDTLKVCWNDRGGERPKSFETKPDSGLEILVLKRVSQ